MSASSPAATRNRTRFPNTEDAQLPEDISDPHTNSDNSDRGLSTKIRGNWKYLLIAVPVGLAAMVIFLRYFLELGVNILANPWVQRGSAVAAIAGTAAYAADRRRQNVIERHQHLILDTPQGAKRFLGEIEASSEDELHFTIYKGLSRFGGLGEPYTVKEISHEMSESWSKAHGGASQLATIRLHPALASVDKTGTGVIAVQETAGLEPDPFARNATLRATIPEYIQEDVADDLREELAQEAQETAELKDRIAKLQRRLDAAKEAGAKTPEEWLNSHQQFATEILQASRSSPSQSSTTDNRTNGSAPGRIDPDQVAQELETDD